MIDLSRTMREASLRALIEHLSSVTLEFSPAAIGTDTEGYQAYEATIPDTAALVRIEVCLEPADTDYLKIEIGTLDDDAFDRTQRETITTFASGKWGVHAGVGGASFKLDAEDIRTWVSSCLQRAVEAECNPFSVPVKNGPENNKTTPRPF